MADKYSTFDELSRNETSGIDFGISVRRVKKAFAIVAPHGGGIEPGTSEIADAIAAEDFSFYAFDGLKSSGNADLHITSTRFDEPMCLTLVGQSDIVLTIHGENSDVDGEPVFLGGLDEELGGSLDAVLTANGFDVRQPDSGLQGREPENICNRGTSGKGVQLELSRALRKELFVALSREGRKCTTAKFRAFVVAIRSVLEETSSHALSSASGQR